MKYCLLTIGLCALFHCGQAQSATEVANAELAFARHARAYNPKAAFLLYADSLGVIFGGGKPRNARRSWRAQPDAGLILWWHPAFASMARSGDLGFTTGPYIVKAPARDTGAQCGHYATVWYRNPAGEWRFLVDLGIGYQGSLFEKQSLTEYSNAGFTPAPASQLLRPVMDTQALAPEQAFVADYDRHGPAAFEAVTTAATWFNLEGQQPFTGAQGLANGLSRVPAGLRFIPTAGGMAASRDMAYVFGNVMNGQKQENYLRVWAHTTDGWKLLLQVLRW